VWAWRIGLQVLRNALADQQHGIDDAGGHKHIEEGARHVDPEVTDGAGGGALDAADKGYGHHDAHRRAAEVVIGEANHLGEIAHGGLGRIELPVSVGGEAGGGVPGEIRPHGGKPLRIPGQKVFAAVRWRRS